MPLGKVHDLGLKPSTLAQVQQWTPCRSPEQGPAAGRDNACEDDVGGDAPSIALHWAAGHHAPTCREREIHYILISHLRADQMCRGSFLGIQACIAPCLSCRQALTWPPACNFAAGNFLTSCQALKTLAHHKLNAPSPRVSSTRAPFVRVLLCMTCGKEELESSQLAFRSWT